MSSCAERLLLLALCLVSVACPASHVCESAELCNGRDDDCDGHTDEGFIDARGRYTGDAHCGRCGVACDQVFASASETACDASGTVPMCTILACAPGSHRAGQGGCVADTYVQCLPCRDDNECAAHTPGARCLDAGGERRCGARCGDGVPCPSPFVCDTALGQCFPELSLCACDKVAASFEVACLGEGAASQLACAGLRTCSARGPSVCVIATAEACNLRDDDCDGQIDEDFLDDGGLYVDRLHCGGCGLPCAAPGPNYRAECLVTGPGARCRVACEAGFVDVDGIEGNGCECQLVGDTTAPRAVGGDANCDGVIDDNDVFVHVAPSGSDKGLGTLVSPLRTIAAAMARGKAENKSVLVAQGSYPPVQIVGGVRVFGGYRTDFLERDPERYPVRIEADGTGDGAPVLTCGDVTQATLIDGVTLVGQDAVTPGLGSTTALFDGCGPDVKLAHVSILAGRGAVGERGADASGRLPPGFSSLSDLDGTSGVSGRAGDSDREQCVAQPGGAGGPKLCGRVNVGGGSGGAASCGATGCSNGRACGNGGCSDFSVAGVCDYDQVLAQAVANPSAEDGRGLVPGAAGRPTYNAPTSRGTCSFCDDNPSLERLGQDGSDGRAGDRGPAGVGCADGPLLFDAVGRASASRGSAGAAGSHGSGGGGGSAGNGYDVIPGTRGSCDDNAGGSGAGAGSGGCGAPGGGGGGGGGASIALAVRVTAAGAGPTFEAVRVVTASGGRGGDGGLGAAGGVGGVGALGGLARFWCTRNGGRGGDGGAGGAGGGGGGGCGGASHALVVRGTASPEYRATAREALTVAQAGVAGRGGAGGFSPGFTGSDGEPGRSDAIR